MSYLKDINNLTISLTNLDDCLLDLSSETDIDDTWQGSAHDAQERKLTDLIAAVNKEKSNVENLISAMRNADNYDSYKKSRDNAIDIINSFDETPNWWNTGYSRYTSAIKARDDATNNMNTEKNNCSNTLGNISSNYKVKYKVITFDDIVDTMSVFDELLNVSNDINNNLNLATAVTTKYHQWKDSLPNWEDTDAWLDNNPYSSHSMGQCTWFACGRFYEMYGYFGFDARWGKDCARDLVDKHPDKFVLEDKPKTGAIFSITGKGCHVGVILDVSEDGIVTYQDGNMNGHNDAFKDAQTDYRTKTCSIDTFCKMWGYPVEFANPI